MPPLTDVLRAAGHLKIPEPACCWAGSEAGWLVRVPGRARKLDKPPVERSSMLDGLGHFSRRRADRLDEAVQLRDQVVGLDGEGRFVGIQLFLAPEQRVVE